MVENGRSPRHRCVARIAFGCGRNMRSAFTARADTVMAARANTRHLSVVDTHNRPPQRDRVASLAYFCRHNVTRTFSCCTAAVVALHAISGNSVVTERCGCPRRGAVTHRTFLRRCDVKRVFTACINAVMASRASAHYLRMVYSLRRRPHRSGMTSFAQIRCGDMRRTLSGGGISIVAA